jgi:NADPH:quinone reductase-like Zn-dependent oxidoreductase
MKGISNTLTERTGKPCRSASLAYHKGIRRVRVIREIYEHPDALMKAVVMKRYGTPDVLELTDVAKPTPKANEALVRVHAASVNDWDWGLLQGTPFVNRMVSGLFTPKVQIIGGDIAGRVEAVGGDVKAFQPGDEVYGDLCMSGFGAFAEYACAPEACLAHKPTRMTFEQAAAIPQAGMLAVQGLIDVGRIQSGQKVLLNGAGGGVGTFALQMAKLYDVEVTVVDKPGKLDMLRAMGADHVIDYLKEDFTKSGKCYDLILDVKTNRSPFAYARALNPNGTYVTVGGETWRLLQALVMGPLTSRIYGKHVRIVTLKPNKDLAYINELFEAGKLIPVIDGPYQLAEVPEAIRHFGTGDHKGKIVVTLR